jgi:hypothetical protein
MLQAACLAGHGFLRQPIRGDGLPWKGKQKWHQTKPSLDVTPVAHIVLTGPNRVRNMFYFPNPCHSPGGT